MDDTEFIKMFLTQREIEPNRNSCLVVALEDARFLSGRNPKTGMYIGIMWCNINKSVMYGSNSFLGLIGYLIFMDLIGGLFRKNGFKSDKNEIYKALKQFSSFNDEEIFVIIALRNSLTHNYSLVNIPNNKNEDDMKLHKFELIYEETDFIISVPLEYDRWIRDDFSENSKADKFNTKIGVQKLINEFEYVYANLKEDYDKDKVTLTLGLEELKARFTITY